MTTGSNPGDTPPTTAGMTTGTGSDGSTPTRDAEEDESRDEAQDASGSLTDAPGAPSMEGTPATDTVPTGAEGTGGGIGARSGSDFERPSGDDAALSGHAAPPEEADAEPQGDPTATFHPGGPGEGR